MARNRELSTQRIKVFSFNYGEERKRREEKRREEKRREERRGENEKV